MADPKPQFIATDDGEAVFVAAPVRGAHSATGQKFTQGGAQVAPSADHWKVIMVPREVAERMCDPRDTAGQPLPPSDLPLPRPASADEVAAYHAEH